MKKEIAGARAALRDLFKNPVMPRKKPDWNNEIAPKVRTWARDENGYRIEVSAPPLMARTVTCSGCGKGTGTLVKVRDGVYAHRDCRARVQQ